MSDMHYVAFFSSPTCSSSMQQDSASVHRAPANVEYCASSHRYSFHPISGHKTQSTTNFAPSLKPSL